jgi:hypothetical protein
MRLPGGVRGWELVPEVGLAVGLTVFAVIEWSAASSAFRSGRAVALMLLTAAAWLILRVALVRLTPWPGLRLAVFSVAALAVLNVVALPALRDETVVETLPARTATPEAGASVERAPRLLDSSSPARLRSGDLRGIDHRATGSAVLYRQLDGTLTVGLEDIDIQPGPDYDVYLVPGAARQDKAGGTRLDDLRGNKGTQYYTVPSAVTVDGGPWTVLVWCQTFGVPVAAATLG